MAARLRSGDADAFIPVELWTGAPWDGTQEIRMAPAALEFGQPLAFAVLVAIGLWKWARSDD